MVRIDAALERERHRALMLLQVHDELVFECPPEEVEAVSRMVKQEMEGVAALNAPLLVEVGVGENWRDAK
jgi:DNA polymerase-1